MAANVPGSVSSYRVTLCAHGAPGPIEERIGRRLVRLVSPDSDEGRTLFREERVELVGPGGEPLGRLSPARALDLLRKRLEARLAEPDAEPERAAIEDGLSRLRRWSARIGSA